MPDNSLVPQFDPQMIFEAMMNPLGSLNLSPTETKLLFFRHLGAEYAQSAKRGRVPYASQLVKSGAAFGGLGGGMDPMMMLMFSQMFNQQKPKAVAVNEIPADDVESVLITILDRLEAIEAKVGGGA
mgnify:CR=1 FL=1|tara:strand:+ start:148 stop:528 length:381 start_codon:yes stop_codon:yes gene_type:complete